MHRIAPAEATGADQHAETHAGNTSTGRSGTLQIGSSPRRPVIVCPATITSAGALTQSFLLPSRSFASCILLPIRLLAGATYDEAARRDNMTKEQTEGGQSVSSTAILTGIKMRQILDGFVALTGYHRKHAVRVLCRERANLLGRGRARNDAMTMRCGLP